MCRLASLQIICNFFYVIRLQIIPFFSNIYCQYLRTKETYTTKYIFNCIEYGVECSQFSYISEAFLIITKLYSDTMTAKTNIFVILAASCSLLNTHTLRYFNGTNITFVFQLEFAEFIFQASMLRPADLPFWLHSQT